MAVADTARLIAALELQDKFTGPARNVEGALGRLEERTGTLGRIGSEAGRGLGNLATNVARIGVLAGGAAITGLVASVNAASDLNEEIDKSAVVFGRAAPEVQAFAEAAAAIGLSRAEALGAAGAFGNMLNTVGLSQDAAADMSIEMVQLAADMASFNNEDPSEMLDKLRSGLSGEAEPLRRFGVLLSEATVKEFAYRKGIAATGDALTEAQKVQARYGLILEQTAIQQGNFALTSDSLANQQRELRARLTNTSAVIGTALLPQVGKLVGRLNDLVIAHQPAIAAFAQELPAVFDRAIEFVGNLPWEAIGTSFELMGKGAGALLTTFTSLPPWVQTAVLTSWGLNKLTGGALGNIVGELGKGLVRGVLGMNAGVVNARAGVVNVAGPAGVGAAGAAGRGGAGALALVGAAAVGITGGVAVAQGNAALGLGVFADTVEEAIASGDEARIRELRDGLRAELGSPIGQLNSLLDSIGVGTGTGAALETAVAQLDAALGSGARAVVDKLVAVEATVARAGQNQAQAEADLNNTAHLQLGHIS
jgi:hypothetical protein